MAIAAAVIAAVAAVATTVATVATSASASADAEEAEGKALALAERKRGDTLKQQREQNTLSYNQLRLQRQQLGQETIQSNRMYKLQRQQMKEQTEMAKRQEQRGATQNALNNFMNYVNSNDQLKNQMLQRYGA